MMALSTDDLDDGPFAPPPSDWRTVEAIKERAERQAAAKASRPRETRFGRLSFGELRERKAKAPDFVVDDWMIAREQSMLAGESQSGKSFLAIHVALCVAAGMEVFGRKTAAGLVIYQAGESGTGVTDLRIPAWVQHFSAADLQLPFEILLAKVDLWSPDGNAKSFIDTVKAIAAEHAPTPLRAVFIDTLSKAMAGANENDGRDVSRVLANAETISRDTGAHVCIVHHFPKGGKTLRGHGSLKADVDTVALVHVDENKVRTLTFDKVKDGEPGHKLQFELMQVRLGERDDGKLITSCVVLPVGEKQAAREEVVNSVRLSTIEMAMFQALWKALAEFGGPPPATLNCSPNEKVVAYDEVKRIYVEASPDDEVEPGADDQAREDARRRHLDRLRKQMKAAADKMRSTWKVLAIGRCKDPDTGKETYYAWWTGRPVRGMPATNPPKPRNQEEAPAALSEGGDWMKDIF